MKNIIITSLLVCFCAFLFGQPVCPSTGITDHVLTGPPVVNPEDPIILFPPYEPPPSPPIDYDRLVYWVHGLGGEPKGWEKASLFYGNDRKMICRRPTYTDISLDGAAITLFEYMDDVGDAEVLEHDIEDVQNNFIIGHSQGGLVGRSLDWVHAQGNANVEGDEGRRFGGVVTFGTPNQGAQILNNIDPNGPNMGQELAAELCEAMSAGPAAALEAELNETLDEGISSSVKAISWLNPVVGLANTIFGNPLGNAAANQVSIEGAGQLVEAGCDEIGNQLIPIVFDPYFSGVTQDYKVGAEYITDLNNFNSEIELVAIHAVEDEGVTSEDPGPMLWRVMSSFLPEDNPNFAPTFQADDETLPARAAQLELEYFMKANEAEDEGLNSVRFAYMKGVWWLQGANLDWAEIIGAASIYEATACHCDVYDDDGNFQYSFPANSEGTTGDCSNVQNLPANASCYPSGATFYNVDIFPSDATVTVASAKDLPGRNQAADVVLEGTNHIEMRNNPETKKAFDALFDGDVNMYFKVEKF